MQHRRRGSGVRPRSGRTAGGSCPKAPRLRLEPTDSLRAKLERVLVGLWDKPHRRSRRDRSPPPTATILSAQLTNHFDYTRSLGPVLSVFALALRDGRIVGSVNSDGKVFVPPVEFDTVTGRASAEFVDVATVGTVVSWSWQEQPVPAQPSDRPFAWALIRLDGADTALLHAVAVDSPPP